MQQSSSPELLLLLSELVLLLQPAAACLGSSAAFCFLGTTDTHSAGQARFCLPVTITLSEIALSETAWIHSSATSLGWSKAIVVIALWSACLPALIANCAGVSPSSAAALSHCFAPNAVHNCSAMASPSGRRAARCRGVSPPGPLQVACKQQPPMRPTYCSLQCNLHIAAYNAIETASNMNPTQHKSEVQQYMKHST